MRIILLLKIKKMKKTTKIFIGILTLLVILVVFWFWKKTLGKDKNFFLLEKKSSEISEFRKENKDIIVEEPSEKKEMSQEISEEDKKMKDWLKKCEAGEEIILVSSENKKTEEIKGKISIDYLENQETEEYFLIDKQGGKEKFSLVGWTEVDLLEGREVVLKGERQGDVFYPISLRCVVLDSTKNNLEYRREIMAEAEKRIGEISQEKGDFIVESFWWHDNEYFYVDFYDKNDEKKYFEALVFVKKEGTKIIFERVAFSKSVNDDGDLELVSGRDLFEDDIDLEETEEENYYEFDEILKLWSPVY